MTPAVIPRPPSPVADPSAGGDDAISQDSSPPRNGGLEVIAIIESTGMETTPDEPGGREKRRFEDENLELLAQPTTMRGPGRPRTTRRLDHYKNIPKRFQDLKKERKSVSLSWEKVIKQCD